jgi:hypothetical protein
MYVATNKEIKMTHSQELVKAAAKFYIQYNGQKGTEKQIAKFISIIQSGHSIVTMARQRGFQG